MKKIFLTALLVISTSTVGLTAPITDFSKDKASVDISYIPSADIEDLDGNTKGIDFGITAALTEKWGLQYLRNGFEIDPIHSNVSVNDYALRQDFEADLKTDQINLIYSESENSAFFVGYTRTKVSTSYSGSISGPMINGSLDIDGSDSVNGFQIGMTEIVPIGKGLKSYGTVGIGTKLYHGELGLSQEISPNAELNVFYKYMKYKDIDFLDDPVVKGLGFGLTCKF